MGRQKIATVGRSRQRKERNGKIRDGRSKLKIGKAWRSEAREG
jgi:hypothetical protein